ncbi:hypothetical protein PsYK624_061470 [Phanerochaete sordida]|uniref:SSCRP protein n=1 Tax=Phanerochaete sordida TaxID=48140 RepID=A0A9P3LC07_9APHY|nr:hypothetical protein PsYK624_061470 [Phanerochaete sordida]
MQLTAAFIVAAASAATALASPSLQARASPDNIGFGQQLQNTDQANHWVTWIDGESACPNTRLLGLLVNSPCGQQFSFNGFTFQLGDCGSDNFPRSLLDANGGFIRSCASHTPKITCHGSEHDIIQHGRCDA